MHFIYCEKDNIEQKSYTPFALSSANFIISYYLIPTLKDKTLFFLLAKVYSPKNKEYFYILDRDYQCDIDIGDKSYFAPTSSTFNKIIKKNKVIYTIFNGNQELQEILHIINYLEKEKMYKTIFSKEIEIELSELFRLNKICYRLKLNQEELGKRINNKNFKFLKEYNFSLLRLD